MPMPDVPPVIALPYLAAEFDRAESAQPERQPRCAVGQAGEIVICAADPKRNRLAALPDSPAEGLPKAELRLGKNTTIDLYAETARISGVPSNRMMVGVKIGF